jgi:hypothetical protein
MTTPQTLPPPSVRNSRVILIALVMTCTCALADQHGRLPSPRDNDPCGIPDTSTAEYRLAASGNWGYGYDSLRSDLSRWSKNPFVHIDSIGATVQNRTIYRLTIEDTLASGSPRKRIWIHARTHPNEVQGTWVTNQIIEQLLGTSQFARQMRSSCVFNIVPMINPDGVELQYLREYAHNIDIESNWTAVPGEPEVQTLRRTFVSLMAQPNPVRIALNMHSAYGTSRYFVYHTATGTTPAYATVEQRFINGVRSYFPGGIKPFDFFVSWTSAPALQYPESWFWQNCREGVLALTYEDMNDASARAFDSTANAILHGIADELGVNGTNDVARKDELPASFFLEQNYPNPFNPTTTIRFTIAGVVALSGAFSSGVEGPGEPRLGTAKSGTEGTGARGARNEGFGGSGLGSSEAGSGVRGLGSRWVRLVVYDILGREVAVLVDEPKVPGAYTAQFNGAGLASGAYIYRLSIEGQTWTRKMVVMK